MRLKILVIMIILVISLSACMFFPKKEPVLPPDEISQWAITASASDAYGGVLGGNRDDQSPYAATGEPDVGLCEDNQKAWTASREDNGIQWLELGYQKQVYVSGVKIRESFGPGAVTKVELKDTESGNEFILWEGKDRTKTCPDYFEVAYSVKEDNITKTMTPDIYDTVKITLDTDIKGWNEIDAVELVGYEQRWYFYNSTLFYENSE